MRVAGAVVVCPQLDLGDVHHLVVLAVLDLPGHRPLPLGVHTRRGRCECRVMRGGHAGGQRKAPSADQRSEAAADHELADANATRALGIRHD